MLLTNAFPSSFNDTMPLNNEMTYFSPAAASLIYPFCSSMCIKNVRCFSSLRSTAPAFLFSVSAVHWGLWCFLVWFLCCSEEYEHAQIQEWKVGCLALNLPPFGLNRCEAYFSMMALLQMGVPGGPVSWLYGERLLRTDTLTKCNNAGQNNYTTALLIH